MKQQTLVRILAAAVLFTGYASAEVLVLDGGTVHTITGDTFVGRVVIEDGTIAAVGRTALVPAGARRLDVSGHHVYPGLFDALGQLGLVEINSVPATVDAAEMGAYNPHLVAATAIHPASQVIPVTRSAGITHALVAPRSDRDGVIAGRATLVHLDGWTVEEMAIVSAAAMIIAWPEIQTRSFDFTTFSIRETPFGDAKKAAEEAQNELRDWFDAARHYRQAQEAGSERLERDLRLEALATVLGGEIPVVIMADAERDIEAAVAFAEEYGLRMILAGGRDAWKVKDLLAEKKIPVILGWVESLPAQADDPYDRPFRTAGELVAAGLEIAFGSGAGGGFGPGGPHTARTLPFGAGMATANGLSEEAAIAALTIGPARMFGLGDRLGSIEEGKIANLIVTDGSPLDITTQVHHVIIAGREVSLTNKHLDLYERYRSRPTPP